MPPELLPPEPVPELSGGVTEPLGVLLPELVLPEFPVVPELPEPPLVLPLGVLLPVPLPEPELPEPLPELEPLPLFVGVFGAETL